MKGDFPISLEPLYPDVEILRQGLSEGAAIGLKRLGRNPEELATDDLIRLYMASVTVTNCLRQLLEQENFGASMLDFARVSMVQRSQGDPLFTRETSCERRGDRG